MWVEDVEDEIIWSCEWQSPMRGSETRHCAEVEGVAYECPVCIIYADTEYDGVCMGGGVSQNPIAESDCMNPHEEIEHLFDS